MVFGTFVHGPKRKIDEEVCSLSCLLQVTYTVVCLSDEVEDTNIFVVAAGKNTQAESERGRVCVCVCVCVCVVCMCALRKFTECGVGTILLTVAMC